MTLAAQDVVDRSLVDLTVLAGWMDGQGLPTGAFDRVELLPGGTQNILLRFERGGRDYVLRRPPPHLRARSNDALRREMRALAAIADTDVPHPGLIAACPDDTVMGGAVFYLMEPIDGFNPSVGVPEPHRSDPAMLREMGFEAVDAIAALGAVDHLAVGLHDFGHPDGFLERQVDRWKHELASYDELDGYPGPDLPGVDRVGRWLDANRPTAWEPGILHGDYHLANVLYDYASPKLAAVVDWEMCTIGDPLLDLGWLLATWPVPDSRTEGAAVGPATALGALDGLPAPNELVDRYAQRSTRDVSAIDWYTVLACFKLGIILEGTHARAFAGKADKAVGDLLHATTVGLFDKALHLIA